MKFDEWLSVCPKKSGGVLKPKSVYSYSQGMKIISKEMMDLGVINKPLETMDLFELDLAILVIFHEPHFLHKNTTGDNMYSNALKKFRCYVCQRGTIGVSETNEEKKILSDNKITKTERETIVKARIGQGPYRDQLMAKFGGRCLITHINLPGLLVASHIKPWSVSSNDDRICRDNGLLLSATYDRLFDTGLITFQNDGKILLSDMITPSK